MHDINAYINVIVCTIKSIVCHTQCTLLNYMNFCTTADCTVEGLQDSIEEKGVDLYADVLYAEICGRS